MIGLIANNLFNQAKEHLLSKSLIISYENNNLLKDFEIQELENIETLIVDASSFNDENCLLDFLYQFKVTFNKKVIVITYNTLINSKIVPLGIYNIIEYQKGIDLTEKIDNYLIKDNELKDVSDYLKLDHLKENDTSYSYDNNVLVLSLNNRVYATTYCLNIQHRSEDNLLYVGIKHNGLIKKFGLSKNNNLYSNEKDYYFLEPNLTSDEVTSNFMYIFNNFSNIICDFKYTKDIPLSSLLPYFSKVIIIKSNDLFEEKDLEPIINELKSLQKEYVVHFDTDLYIKSIQSHIIDDSKYTKLLVGNFGKDKSNNGAELITQNLRKAYDGIRNKILK
ncbi:MAG: hypothetical protein ACK5HS_02510 [Mycoplasmatales bacterium]